MQGRLEITVVLSPERALFPIHNSTSILRHSNDIAYRPGPQTYDTTLMLPTLLVSEAASVTTSRERAEKSLLGALELSETASDSSVIDL